MRFLLFIVCLLVVLAGFYWLMNAYDVKTAFIALGAFLVASMVIGTIRRIAARKG